MSVILILLYHWALRSAESCKILQSVTVSKQKSSAEAECDAKLLLLFYSGAVTAAHLRMATVMASEELAHGQITSGRSPRDWNTLRKASQEDIDPVVTQTHTHADTNIWIICLMTPGGLFYKWDCRLTHMGLLHQLQSACAVSSGWCLSGLSGPAETSACPSISPPLPELHEVPKDKERGWHHLMKTCVVQLVGQSQITKSDSR